MNEEITISEAVPEYAEAITNVLYKAWLATYPSMEVGVTVEDIEDSYKDEFSEEKISNLQKVIRENSNNVKRLVAKYGNKIIAYCVVKIEEDRNLLRTIYILPEFQSRGVGSKLWLEAKKFLKKEKDVYVYVAEYTKQAINFYKKLGFVDTGKRIPDSKTNLKSGTIMIDMEMKLDKSLL